LQRALPALARGHALALARQALGDPLRQGGPIDWVELHGRTKILERGEPGAGTGLPIQLGQQHQGQRAVVALGLLGQLLQGHAAVLAGLARGNPHLQDLPVGEQAE
jgi:hypothetical protein